MAHLPTAARQAVARRTRPTRPRLVACVLLGVRWQADVASAAGGRDAALPAARAVDFGCRCWRRGGRCLIIGVCDDVPMTASEQAAAKGGPITQVPVDLGGE